jgi:hypothetical protein
LEVWQAWLAWRSKSWAAAASWSSWCWLCTRAFWAATTSVDDAWVELPVEVLPVAVLDVVWLALAVASEFSAVATACSALVTAAWSEATFRLARVAPAVTVWPAVTSTLATVPGTRKLAVAWLTGVMVPTDEMLETVLPTVADAVW